MKIAIACDHAGYEYKEKLVAFLRQKGYEVKDFGTHSAESMDYPDTAHPMAAAVESGEFERGIHPDYYQAKVVCNCGNEFVTGSTKEEIHVEICSKCHPFYTGQQKASSTRGRIDKFNKKYGVSNN